MLGNRNLGLIGVLILFIGFLAAVAIADVHDTSTHSLEMDTGEGENDSPASFEYWLLILGWGLGLVSGVVTGIMAPLVIDGIRRRRSAEQAREGLHTLLERLRFRAAHLALQNWASLGMKIGAKTTSWLRPIVTDYNGPDKDEELERAINSALNTDPDNEPLDTWVKTYTTPGKNLAGEHLGNPQVAQQMMSNIPLLSPIAQMQLQQILDLLYRSDYYSRMFRMWLEKSFDESLSDSHIAMIDANMKECINMFAAKCKNIADAITVVLPDLK